MRIYIHEGAGHYIGSAIIVLAGTKKTAEKLIREELVSCGLTEEELNIREVDITKKIPFVIYSNDGDY